MLRRLLTPGLVALVLVAMVLVGCAESADTAETMPVDCTVDKCVALTFDDGPTPFTDRLLKVLNDADAKATFFMIGNKVAANPAGAKRVAEAGMEIGNHTWEHPNMTTIPVAEIPAQFTNPCNTPNSLCARLIAARADASSQTSVRINRA